MRNRINHDWICLQATTMTYSMSVGGLAIEVMKTKQWIQDCEFNADQSVDHTAPM